MELRFVSYGYDSVTIAIPMELLSFKIPRIIQMLPVLAKGFGLIFSIAAGMKYIFIAPLTSNFDCNVVCEIELEVKLRV